METTDFIVLIWGIIACFASGQIAASGNIGNRTFSIWYSTHFLIEKRGICHWIYYKPKHFDRYTLYEVVSFFASFLWIPIFVLLGTFRYINLINSKALWVVAASIMTLEFFTQLIIALINDIGSRKDEKKKFYLEQGARKTVSFTPMPEIGSGDKIAEKAIEYFVSNRNNAYFTVHNLWDSYHRRLKEAKNDPQKQNQVHLDYIEYFKSIEHLVVVKENKNGLLQLKIQK